MFFNHKKNDTKVADDGSGKIFAVQNGEVVAVTEVNDEVFAQKILGDGIAIKAESGEIVSPVDGKISSIADTSHAFGIQTADGLEILVHIGINTVELNGRGFKSRVKLNQNVKTGQPLCDVDLSFLTQNKLDTSVIVLITNIGDLAEPPVLFTGVKAQAGQTCIMEYRK